MARGRLYLAGLMTALVVATVLLVNVLPAWPASSGGEVVSAPGAGPAPASEIAPTATATPVASPGAAVGDPPGGALPGDDEDGARPRHAYADGPPAAGPDTSALIVEPAGRQGREHRDGDEMDGSDEPERHDDGSREGPRDDLRRSRGGSDSGISNHD